MRDSAPRVLAADTTGNLIFSIHTGWTVGLTFANGQQITQIWGGRTTLGSNPYTIVNETWNNVIAPNATTSFGFLASWNGTNAAPTFTCTRTP